MSMIDRRPKAREDVNYWRSMVDVVLGILLVVLLAMSLLILGLLDRPLLEESAEAYEVAPAPSVFFPEGGPDATPTLTPTAATTPTPSPTPTDDDGGGGTDATPGPTPTEVPMPSPEPFGDDSRSAVLVRVRDEETHQLLTVAGIGFEVYDGEETQLAYDVYYPEHVKYSQFNTTKNGDFYLPEKLLPGEYTLENVIAPVDYDFTDAVSFTVVEGKSWDDPILVDVFMSPATSTIRLEMKDAASGQPVVGGAYEVVAALDVITSDGTVRYPAGETIETLSGDRWGAAQTGPLYLGTFRLVQTEIPFGYARADMGAPVTIKKKPMEYVVSLTMEKTTALLTVRDELTLARVAGIPFVLTGGDAQPMEIVADGNGEIRLTNLDKDTDYSFTMKGAVDGYLQSGAVYSFHVDRDGRIEGNALYELSVDARKIRCSFGAESALFGKPITGHDMGLFRADGTVIEQWYSGEEPQHVEGLEPGAYVLTMDGREMRVTVRDTAEQQTVLFRVWQAEDLAALAAAGLALTGILAAALLVSKNKKKRTSSGSGTPGA